MLKLHGHDVALIDLRLDRSSALRSALTSPQPDAVGISCGFTTDVYSTLWTARAVKETIPGTPVFVGGHHASLIPGDFLFAGSPVDAVVIGEGEWTGLDLADALERGDDPASVPGVLTLDNRRRLQAASPRHQSGRPAAARSPPDAMPVDSGPSSVITLAVMTLPTIQGGKVEEYR